MTKKEREILDKEIQYLCEDQGRIRAIRLAVDINPEYTFLREVETIESLYIGILEDRKRYKEKYLECSSSGWTIEYFRKKNKYQKNEKFNLKIYFSFVQSDNFE